MVGDSTSPAIELDIRTRFDSKGYLLGNGTGISWVNSPFDCVRTPVSLVLVAGGKVGRLVLVEPGGNTQPVSNSCLSEHWEKVLTTDAHREGRTRIHIFDHLCPAFGVLTFPLRRFGGRQGRGCITFNIACGQFRRFSCLGGLAHF